LLTRDRYPDRFVVGYFPHPLLPEAPRLFEAAYGSTERVSAASGSSGCRSTTRAAWRSSAKRGNWAARSCCTWMSRTCRIGRPGGRPRGPLPLLPAPPVRAGLLRRRSAGILADAGTAFRCPGAAVLRERPLVG